MDKHRGEKYHGKVQGKRKSTGVKAPYPYLYLYPGNGNVEITCNNTWCNKLFEFSLHLHSITFCSQFHLFLFFVIHHALRAFNFWYIIITSFKSLTVMQTLTFQVFTEDFLTSIQQKLHDLEKCHKKPGFVSLSHFRFRHMYWVRARSYRPSGVEHVSDHLTVHAKCKMVCTAFRWSEKSST